MSAHLKKQSSVLTLWIDFIKERTLPASGDMLECAVTLGPVVQVASAEVRTDAEQAEGMMSLGLRLLASTTWTTVRS